MLALLLSHLAFAETVLCGQLRRFHPRGLVRHASMETENLQRVCTNIVTTSPQPETQLELALATILAEARSQVAAGREPNEAGLETRIG